MNRILKNQPFNLVLGANRTVELVLSEQNNKKDGSPTNKAKPI